MRESVYCFVIAAVTPTFLCRRNLDDVVSQRCSFSHAVTDVIHSPVSLDVWVGCHSINVDVVAHVNLRRNESHRKSSEADKR